MSSQDAATGESLSTNTKANCVVPQRRMRDTVLGDFDVWTSIAQMADHTRRIQSDGSVRAGADSASGGSQTHASFAEGKRACVAGSDEGDANNEFRRIRTFRISSLALPELIF